MAVVDSSLQLGYKNNTWFTSNASLVLLEGQIVYLEQTGTYKIGDGVTTLSALSFLGGNGGGAVETVTGTNVDNTDPLNPIVLEQTTLISPDGNTSVFASDSQASLSSSDGVDSSTVYVQPESIQLNSASVTKNGEEIATINEVVPYTGATGDVDLDANSLNAKSLHVKGTGGAGHLGLKHQSANITASPEESSLGANSSGNPVWKNDGNPIQELAFKTTDYYQKFSHTGGTYTLTVAPISIYSIRTTTMILDESDINDVIISGNNLTVTNPNFLAGETLFIKYKA